MNQFVFTSRERMTFFIMMGVGALSLAWAFFVGDDFHARFWSNYLHNAVFFTGIAAMGLFFIGVTITAWGGWSTLFKRIWEAYSMFLIVGVGLMLVVALGLWIGYHKLYHWNDAASVADDVILQGKASFLNKGWYTFGTLGIIAAWYFFATKIRSISKAEDANGDRSFSHHHRLRVWAAATLPLIGFTMVPVVWQWVMSIDAHWYSTMFAWYAGSSWFVSMICLTILIIIYLKSRGYYSQINEEHLHDLGKFLFAFSIFWTYLWFSQYMLIWYANVGEETVYFRHRLDNYKVLFYANLAINFVLPFLILMRNDTKRKYGTLVFTSCVVFFGHWLDYFLMIKPGVLHTTHELAGHGGHGEAHGAHEAAGHAAGHAAEHGHEAAAHVAEAAHHASEFVSGYTLPGFLEIGAMIGFLGLFLYVTFSSLTKASLVPENDPYIAESVHHHA